MNTILFKPSEKFTLGVELELQLIDTASYDLSSCAKELLREIKNSVYSERIKPEITQSMIELNSSIHQNPASLLAELKELKHFLVQTAAQLNFAVAGGGTHPFQCWSKQAIFPAHRFRNASRVLGYMAKSFTVFGLHVHLGCADADTAIYLCHMLSAYVPHFIALSASSPYYQAVDTTYDSCRLNVINALPLGGAMPYLKNGHELMSYCARMQRLGVIKTMKDFHWDIRPKYEFGTVEIRVCDMPLTLEQTVAIAAYVQTLGHHLLETKLPLMDRRAYDVYQYNRFQASRFGFCGDYIDPFTEQHSLVKGAILSTLERIKSSAAQLNTGAFLQPIQAEATAGKNDASWLRDIFKQAGDLPEVVRRQCRLWAEEV